MFLGLRGEGHRGSCLHTVYSVLEPRLGLTHRQLELILQLEALGRAVPVATGRGHYVYCLV